MSKQAEAWAGEFGNDYLKRNRVDWHKRIPFWDDIIAVTGARSVTEFGCNAGWNLSAIKYFSDVHVCGHEINPDAIEQAFSAGLNVCNFESLPKAELVFTAGVLIHISPEDIDSVMDEIIAASYDYVLAVEYESHTGDVEPVEYHGNTDMLWRRDYGKMYQDKGLTLVEKFDAGEGFDNCTAWLLRK